MEFANIRTKYYVDFLLYYQMYSSSGKRHLIDNGENKCIGKPQNLTNLSNQTK